METAMHRRFHAPRKHPAC